MRTCSKSHCSQPAVATIALRYERRQVAMVDLLAERDPNHMELCQEHADRLVPPIGWTVQDERSGRGFADPLAALHAPELAERLR
jgi:uncharacterized protein DUF3499